MTKKLLLTFALLLTAVTGAFADFPQPGDVWDETTKTLTVNSDPGQQAYKESAEIQHLVIASGVTSIGEGVFAFCDNLATVTFAAGSQLTTIGNSAFYCTGLTSIEIPASVTSIDEFAFNSCSGLTTVSFAAGSQLTTIGNGAFSQCSGLTSIEIPASVTSIGDWAFNGCSGLTSINIPAGVTSIGSGVFASCDNLATVTFAAGSQLEAIGGYAFSLSGLASIEIPASVTSISEYTFDGCTGLTTVSFAAGSQLTTIGNGAFNYCTGLTSIEIPASVTSIGNNAFGSCSSLATISVEAGNEKYDSRNDCNAIIEKSSNTLIIGCKNTTIPASVTSIGDWAFNGCSGLTSIEIPASVTSIGSGAFSECTGLATVSFAAGSQLTTIGDDAFQGCEDLASIEIPAGVTSIGELAFTGCFNMATVTVYTPDCTLGDNAFNYSDNLTIYVFSDLVSQYQTNWSAYAGKIKEMPNPNGKCGENVRWVLTGESPNYTLTISGTGAMADYASSSDQPWKDYRSSITTVVIGSGVTHIGNNAFDGVDAKFSAFVTKDNFFSYFDGDGSLNVTFDELIFQGEFSGSDIVNYIVLNRPITITGDNAVLKNMGFVIYSEDVTLDNMTLNATTSLGDLINVAASKVDLTNLTISYIVDDGGANVTNVINVADATITNVNIKNNSIYFESHATTDENLVTVINLDNVEDVNVEGNTIVASMPGLSVSNYDFDYLMMGLCYVNPVRVYVSNSVKLTNNKIDVTVNSYAESYPVVQALYIVGSEDIHVEGNDFKMVDEITPEGTPIYLYAVECGYSEGIEFNKNNFDISTKGGQSGNGSVYVLQVVTTEATFIGNNITCQSNASSLGICSPYGYGPAKDLIIKENILDITGNATESSEYALISGIEIQTGYATISNNTIYVQNKGGYDDTYPVSGISAAQYSASTLFDIQNNEVYVPDGKYAVDIRYAPQEATVTGNALCAHELFGDDAVSIASGSGNTVVENNILGYVMPKTGESTYNIPANVSSFKVYDDGGKGRRYSPGCDGTLTLTAPEGYRLQLSGNITTEKDVDYLSVYDGSSNLADVLINQVSSSVSGELTDIPTVTSTGQSITFYFHSDNSDSDNSEFDGLDLTVTLVYTIDETTQNGGVVPDNVTTTTLTYTRTIPNSGDAWTVCLPYEPPTGDDLKYYTLESVSGTTLNFTEVTSPQAQTPYLVVASSDASVGTSAATVVNFSAEVQNPEAVDGYQFKGTLRGLDHDASVGKYILQSNNKWGIVLAEKTSVYIPPFRAYIESTSDARSLDSNLNDGTTGVDTIRTIDADGTEQWFDLSGRHIDKPTKKGLYIHNGKKEIVK